MIQRRPLLLAVLAAACAFCPADVGAQQPDKPRAVIELFTSQGCSSCPPADALFVTLARDPSLIVLTLPVDYWDYLGWRDTLAHAAFSQRQRNYAKTRGDGHVYTPQAVVDGAAHTVGSDRAAIEQLMRQRAEPVLPLDVAIASRAEGLSISISGTAPAASASIWLIPTARSRQVAVQRGENRGRDIAYANVARGLTRIGSWRGQPVTIDLPVSLTRSDDSDGFVVLVQADDGKVGRVIGAARGPGF